MKDLSLNEIVTRYPGSRFVFEEFRFDYCCGGKQQLSHICEKRNINPETVIEAINKRATLKEDVIDFSNWPLDLLIDYIEKKHHRYVNDNLGHILEKLERLVARHGMENPYLLELQELFNQLAINLSAHMKKEELILFPYIRNLINTVRNSGEWQMPGFATVQNPILMMENEHQAEGERLARIAALTNNYTPPPQACATWQYSYEKLAEFEKDLHMHIHLENNLLFPEAIKLEASLREQVSTLA